MKKFRRYFAVYIPLLLSFISWMCFAICCWQMYYNGYEAGWKEGQNRTLKKVNILAAEDGVKYEVSEE